MSGRNMALDVLVRLKDLLSGPLKRAQGVVKGFTDSIRKIGLVGSAIAAISFTAPIAEAAQFQQKLLDISTTAELTNKAAFDFVNKQKVQYEGLSFTFGQFSDTIAAGAGKMIAAGLDQGAVDSSLGAIAKNATAANAQFEDMAGVAISLIQTLRVPANQMDNSMAALIVSAKMGSFEMREMARYFPTLTSQVAKFGVTGREAVNFLGAALQIAMKGTSEPAEAANNLKNFLSKILAPVTIKTFKEAGVDIQAVMQDAATKGINPIEAVIQKISKLTGVSGKEIEGLMKKAKANGLEGAEALGYVRDQLQKIHGAGKLGELFQDQQVLDFLIPFLNNLEEYKRIKEEVAKATGANSQADFDTQMQGLNRQFMIFQEVGVQAVREVGLAFGTWLPTINQHLISTLKWLRETDDKTGGMVRNALAFGGAAILLAGGLGVLGMVLPVIASGLSLATGPLALLAALGYLIYRNWSNIGPMVSEAMKDFGSGFWQWLDPIKTSGAGTADAIVGIANGIVRLGSGLMRLAGIGDGNPGSVFKTLGDVIGGTLALAITIIENLAKGIEWVVNALANLVDAINKGINWSALIPQGVVDAWNGIATAIERVQALLNGGVTISPNRGRNGLDGAGPPTNGNTPAPQAPARGRNGLPVSPAVAPASGNSRADIFIHADAGTKVTDTKTASTGNNAPRINTGKSVGRA